MNPEQRKRANKAIRESYADLLTPEIERLISLATFDLFFGPIGPTDDDGKEWPGFSRSTEILADALNPIAFYWNAECEYGTSTEPDWSATDDEGMLFENPEDWYEFEARDVKRAIFGDELSKYL